ncbi:hypothetical protein BSKO_00612 [Bryopsis sp. KO-2023]|nr:hypothetical protein BSKO_00612 [Bryopsis sp. KO-2023]
MESLRNFFGASQDDGPSESVLAEWNKYSGEGDIEAGTGGAESSTGLGGSVKDVLKGSFNKMTSGLSTVSSSATTAVQNVPSRQQWYYFAAFLTGGLVMLFLAFSVALPIIVLSPSKFAFSFTLGSVLIMSAFTVLKGWKQQMKHMISKERIPFSAGYVGSMLGTLYAAVVMKSYLFSLICSGLQVVALLYYLMSYFPGGSDGVKFVLGVFYQSMKGCFGMVFRSK